MGKTEKKIHFIGGTPRSGSTIFANILAQNPNFHSTATSGILEVMFAARNRMGELPAFRAMEESQLESKKENVLRAILYGYFADVDKPVCFDKSRGWEGYLEMLEVVLQRKPKILVPVRDVRDILASFEKLYRKTVGTRQLPDEKSFFFKTKTVEGRCELLLMNEGGVIGVPVNMIRDAVARGWRKQMHFIEYEKLTSKPMQIMKEVYEFLDEPWFDHDFDSVEQVTYEDDLIHTYKDLHKIRPKVEPQEPQWPKYLPQNVSNNYAADACFWKTLL